jgi:hypothetical protein
MGLLFFDPENGGSMFFVKITIFWDVMDCSVQPASAIFRIEE